MAEPGQFAGLLIQTAVVYRRAQAGGGDETDRFGQPVEAPTDGAHEVGRWPCRCTVPRGGRRFGERMQDVVETTHELFLDVDADLVENDVVTVLMLPIAEGGAEADPAVAQRVVRGARVKLVRPIIDGEGLHHYEADLTTQRAATSASARDPD